MATTFELIQSKANQICDKAEYFSDLEVDKGVKYILDSINDKMNRLKPEDFTFKIEEEKISPYITVKWRIMSFVIHNQYFDFSEFAECFDAIIKHYQKFNNVKTEKYFLDETMRVKTEKNKIIFTPKDNTIPNRIEVDGMINPERCFTVQIYQSII